MKSNHLIFAFLIMFSGFGLVSCDSSSGQENTGDAISDIPVKVTVINGYSLDPSTSKADWNRTLDQKPTHQKVKLFGKEMDVELGAVKLSSNGNVTVKEGMLSTTDGEITQATVVFDMASFKFSKEKGHGIFDVTKYPNSTLEISDISTDTSGTHAKGKLTIHEVTNEVDIKMNIQQSDSIQSLKGSFVVNTLDFPLRDQVTKKDVNKDEIAIFFNLKYLFTDTKNQ